MIKELKRVDWPVDLKDVNMAILSRLISQYDAEVRMLESSSDRPTRGWIECAVIDQYDRFEVEKSGAGAKTLTAARESSHQLHSAETYVLCLRAGHDAVTEWQYRIVKREPNEDGRRGNSNGSGNVRRGGSGGSCNGNG